MPWYVVAHYLKLDFEFDPKPALSLTGLVQQLQNDICNPKHTHTHTHTHRINIKRSNLAIRTYQKVFNIDIFWYNEPVTIAFDTQLETAVNICVNNLYKNRLIRPASLSSGPGLWLLIMRSRVRFPVLPWECFLAGKDSRGDHGLGS